MSSILLLLLLAAGAVAWSAPGPTALAERKIVVAHGSFGAAPALARAAATTPQSQHTLYIPLVVRAPASSPPAIARFVASPATITPNGTSTLSWQVSGATSLSISPGIGPVSGSSVVVRPSARTEYTLTASNAVGSISAKAIVDVRSSDGNADPISYFLPYRFGDSIMTAKVPQIALDPAGGTHVVYTANYVDGNGKRPAYYGYCPSNCTSASHFTIVGLGDNLSYAQLALTPDGHPRVLLATWPPDGILQYQYGECDGSCTSLNSWQLTTIANGQSSFFLSDAENNQSFALDRQGRPRFIYYVNSFGTNDQAGVLYTYCNVDCTDAGNWSTTQLTDAEWKNMELAFTPDGRPLLALVLNSGEPDYETRLAYIECAAADCSNWSGLPLLTAATYVTGGGSVFALRADAQGRPRLAYYPGTGSGGTLETGKLYYLSCDVGCAQAGSSWKALQIPLPDHTDQVSIQSGDGGVDLALDKQGRPRVAYRLGGGVDELGYTWCDTACADAGAVWPYQVIWSTAAAEAELGHIRSGCPDCIPPITCTGSFWNAGYWPSLALDAIGNPRIAYEVQLWSGGGACTVGAIARVPRVAIFDQP